MSESEVRVTISGYRDLTRVGSGGFSMVYRAHQIAFDRDVAVKVLTVELVDENAQRRFQRECRASGRLSNHPNIVTVLDSGFTDDGRPFITTEFMSHGSLADRLDEDGPYPLDEVLDIGVKMCSALAAVHAAGILHRDIKPQNILVSDYGEPALADFGISAITIGPDASIGTSSITPLHVAPEILEGQPTSEASDVYALGSTLYTLLAGRAPFQQSDDDALLPLMRRVVMDPVPDIDNPAVGPATMDLLRYTMEKQPFARYQTAIALGEAIQGLQAHLGMPVTPMRKPGRTTGIPTAGAADPAAVISGDFPADPIGPGVVPPPPAAAGPAAPGSPAGLTTTPPPDGVLGAATMAPAPVGAGGPGAGGPGAVGAPPTTGPDRTSASRTPLLVGLGILVVLVLVGGAVVALTRSGGDVTAGVTTTVKVGGAAGAGGPTSSEAPSDPGGTDAGESTTSAPAQTPGARFDVDAQGADESEPTPGGTLKVGIESDGNGWNPSEVRFYGGMPLVANAIYEPLMVMLDDGPHPYLAPSVTPNDTYDEWAIDVPSGVTFHDGSDLNAEAIKDNFDTRLANDLNAALLAPVESVRVEGSHVVVKMRTPWPAFPVALTGQSGLVVAPATLHDPAGLKPIGTGPFMFESYEAGVSFKAKKNPTYRVAGRPYLDGIDFKIILDGATRRQGLESGDLDLIQVTDPSAVIDLQGTHTVVGSKEGQVASVLFNTADAQMKDLRLRHALASGLNNEALIKAVFNGTAYPANSLLPADSPWSKSDINRIYFDLPTAQKYLAEYTADHPGPVKVRLTVNSSASQQAAARALQTMWKDVGVDVEIATPESPLGEIVDGTFQIALWTFDVPTDPDEIYVWFHTDPKAGDFTYNLSRLADSNIDKYFDKGRRSAQLTERGAAYAGAEQGLIDVVPATFYAFLPNALASSTRVVGWKKATQGGFGRGGNPWATDLGFK